MDAGEEHRHALQIPRQRADIIDAGEMHQLANLLEADFSFAAPSHTASPVPDLAKSTRLPATALPSLI
ncbi:MAG: hypothetical protein EXR33_05305 [Betaproteobacteria bacterium]|nr:hypothetical protein [Betaproteobacteria bacterium]